MKVPEKKKKKTTKKVVLPYDPAFSLLGIYPEKIILQNDTCRSSCCGAAETNPTRNHGVSGSIPGLAQWVEDPVLP